MVNELEEARKKIDRVDREIALLFSQRMDAVRSVIKSKMKTGKPVYDPSREQIVIEKNLNYIENQEYKPYYRDFISHTMEISRKWQLSIIFGNTVAYQGVEGAFSQIAASLAFPQSATKAYPTWQDVVNAILEEKAAFGVLPFENSQSGDVSDVLDLCIQNDIYIQAMVDLKVSQNLLTIKEGNLSAVTDVYSHPQGLSQCRKFLDSLGVRLHTMANTALAAKFVAESNDPTKAAIASFQTADIYGLNIAAKNINTADSNTTRFIVVGKAPQNVGNRVSIIFTVPHMAGSLARAIETISNMGYNMETIKSRPMPNAPWEYYFYVELIREDIEDDATKLMEELKSFCKTTKVLGIYEKTVLD